MHKDLLSKINRFYSFASNSILKSLADIETFKDRIDFAEKHLEHLSSGSSRIIYITPDQEVLKLAKNERGVAQNKAEASPKLNSKFINKTLSADKNGLFKISPYLKKVTEKEFEELTDFSFKDFADALDYALKETSSSPPSNDIVKSELFKEIVRCAKAIHLVSGDLGRISSWGQDNNHPVLLDAGLTQEIYDKFYDKDTGKPRSKS